MEISYNREQEIADLANNCGNSQTGSEALVERYEGLALRGELNLIITAANKQEIITELNSYSWQDPARIAALVKKIESIP